MLGTGETWMRTVLAWLCVSTAGTGTWKVYSLVQSSRCYKKMSHLGTRRGLLAMTIQAQGLCGHAQKQEGVIKKNETNVVGEGFGCPHEVGTG